LFKHKYSKNYKGIKVVPLRVRAYDENVETVVDKNGNFSYRLSARYIPGRKNKGTDVDMADKGYISVTPLRIDHTDFALIKK
jgi:5'-nucleotidase